MNSRLTLTKAQQAEKELIQSIIIKCWEDESFKKNLISSPEKTIAKLTGKPFQIPNGKNLIVVDQSNDSRKHYINIPSAPNFDQLELTEEELELIAGGFPPAIAASSVPCGAWAGGFIIGLVAAFR